MPLRPRDFRRIGPKEGEPFPDVRLPDQTGALVDLHAARALTVELTIARGFHVSAAPVPEGLALLSAEVAPIEGLEVGPASWPAPRRFEMPELGDQLWVHEGTVRGTVPLTFTGAPGGGDLAVEITVRYQACDDSSCLMPSSLRLELPVREVALVDRSLQSPGAPSGGAR